ncbi:MAG: type IV toxin-antitoxin system AbiEi family antitoxin, partial [Thermodesulfobacteriota bacterium]
MKPSEFIKSLNNKGIWSFTSEVAQEQLGDSALSVLRKLLEEGRIISPGRGFYAIIPEEYSISGRIPMDRYIDNLMRYYKVPYYIGLLSAAAYYGSSHQSPQILQVITNPSRRPIRKGRNKIVFYRKKNIKKIEKVLRNTPTGYINLSTVETTFFDMIMYYRQVGGLDQVYQVASEMTVLFTSGGLLKSAKNFPLPVVQRGGFILEQLGYRKGINKLNLYIIKENAL